MPSTRCEDGPDAGTAGAAASDRIYLLGLADDALIASHRLSEWVARAPDLEEDIALANIALDLLGQARMLLGYAGELTDPVLTEDDLAYLRPADEFRNAVLVERPNGDFAVTIVRLLLLAAYQYELYAGLRTAADARLAAIAAKSVKEVAYHRDHARLWTLRLGSGTAESRRRMETALAAEWPWFCALLGDDRADRSCRHWVAEVLGTATLELPEDRVATPSGRDGVHTPDLDAILAEMREVTAAHPGATW
ncbi:phenylacetate-CoA oxygenase subunit PaaI [Nocardioides marmoriginsengisoli]|uniref:Phenylacetate-CoA oxygenase subunit PaaI n=1 Tax=Nocardioides marmoriginsengisoli TaxID=661483 RepID=A0A3N0CP23_9ACTN|nr:1,2-phenylacetyl-CoA epoxidase subunit PaaC [Nocardioides marmoriginsengisoli]RNL65061.1 phenylacetate-CoA oxygenase subunit PaaI [Nocardioides marmoriginsengisoli]